MSRIICQNGKNIVLVEALEFLSRRSTDFTVAEKKLRRYIGRCISIREYSEEIHIAADFPDEFCHSNDTVRLKGGNRKAKANMINVIPELVENAMNKVETEDYKGKHGNKAAKGWNQYNTYFAFMNEEQNTIDIYRARMLVRIDANGKKYLYDFVRIKKEASNPL